MRPFGSLFPIEVRPDIRGKLVRGELVTRRFLAERSLRPANQQGGLPELLVASSVNLKCSGKEYSIVQGIKPGTWKWTVRLDENNVRTGVDKTRNATWEDAYNKLIGAVALEKVKVIGRRESIPEVIPGAYFAPCPSLLSGMATASDLLRLARCTFEAAFTRTRFNGLIIQMNSLWVPKQFGSKSSLANLTSVEMCPCAAIGPNDYRL